MNTVLLALLNTPWAHAFCGTYVSTDAGAVVNHDSQVVVAIENGRTVLTLANDFEGAVADFGLVIPLPGTVTAADVSVVDRAALDRIDAYTAPRTVRYSCSDVVWVPGDSGGWVDYGPGGSSGCGGSSDEPATFEQQSSADSGAYQGGGLGSSTFAGGTTAERFTAGEYELALVDATGVGSLDAWLADNGFDLPTGARALIAEAIGGGARFLVARVSAESLAGAEARSWLSPIQVRYAGEEVVLPVRLGATAAGGQQDILVYGITTMAAGALAVANYPSVPVEEDCILGDSDGDGAFDDLGTGYEALFDLSHTAADRGGRAGWTLEFNSPQGVCDPLPPDGPIESSTLVALGFEGGVDNANLARIHLRGQPGEIDQDLVLYASGFTRYWQQAYIEDAPEMRAYFPVCAQGMEAGAEGCPEPDYEPPSADDAADVANEARDEAEEASNSCLCATGVFPPLLVLAAAASRRRRR